MTFHIYENDRWLLFIFNHLKIEKKPKKNELMRMLSFANFGSFIPTFICPSEC
jgi:hypothetical protein